MTKPGYKTSELWFSVGAALAIIALVPLAGLPVWFAAVCAAGSSVAYTIARATTKIKGEIQLDQEMLEAIAEAATEEREKRN